MPDYLPVYKPGESLPQTTSAAVTGGQVVAVSGSGTVAPTAGPVAAVCGVAAFDAASGTRVLVHVAGVHRVTASAAITAGQAVASAASGQVAPLGTGTIDLIIGYALTTAAAGAAVEVQFIR